MNLFTNGCMLAFSLSLLYNIILGEFSPMIRAY